ncbi:MAG: hypothetical protein HYR91_02935 [Flavobacteriia bacterium]|nr:hypothetical protein [Flavobacteriia bacterium]
MRRSRKYFDIVLKSCNYTRKDVSAFTGVANHFGLIGVLSRHGELKKGIPKDQMSLRESQILILSLCKSFLKSTYGLG